MAEFSNVTDQTANRAYNTVYQNLTGRSILVQVSNACSINAQTIASGSKAQAFVGPNNPPTLLVEEAGFLDSIFDGAILAPLVFVVPAGFFYEVVGYVDNNSTIGITHWIEVL
jgi:hypothetical protein